MKLATLRNRTRDGRLVVVSRDLTMCTEVGHIVGTMQAALDDWAHVAPRLERVAQGLETGSQPTFRFHEHDAMSPLPRAYRRIDATTGREGGSGATDGPRDPLSLTGGNVSASAGFGAIIGDVPAGAGEDEACAAIRLIALVCDISLGDGENDIVGSAFSPVAVSPASLGEAWNGGTLTLPLTLRINDGGASSSDAVAIDLAAAIVRAARHRPLHAGTVITAQMLPPGTPLAAGDTLRIEMKDAGGHSLFGAIERTVAGRQNRPEERQEER